MKRCTNCQRDKHEKYFRVVTDTNQKTGNVSCYLKSHCKECEKYGRVVRSNREFDKFVLDNSIHIINYNAPHEGLNNLLTDLFKEMRLDWHSLKSKSKNYKNLGFDLDIWGDEYLAIVAACIYQHAPFANRITFVSSFINRTINQVKDLISMHYRRYYAFAEDDNYTEVFVTFYMHIGLYFKQLYKVYYETIPTGRKKTNS